MKKIISVALCAVMLLGIMVTAVFAEVPDEAWKLSEYGQKSIYLGTEVDVAPVVDGKVNEGEYAVEFKDMLLADDDASDSFFVVDAPSDIDKFSVYLSYDFDFIYLAVETHDTNLATGDGLIVSLGLNDNIDEAIAFRARHNIPDDPITAPPMNLWFFGKDLAVEPDESAGPAEAYEYISRCGGYDEATQTATYEFAFTRTALEGLEDGDIIDRLYFRLNIQATDGSIVYGFKNDEVAGKYHSWLSRFPHVIYLTEEPETPETEAPVTEAPETGAPATDAPETEAPTTDAPNETETPAESGCGSSVATMGVALVAVLGTCTAFISKKR